MKILPLLYIIFSLAEYLPAQPCTVTASANPTAVCSPGGVVTLSGNASGGSLLSTAWTPTAGLSNPNGLTTQANVSAPTTYTFTARMQTNNNLVYNGDFSLGNAGFSSAFSYVAPGPGFLAGGTYSIFVSPSQVSAAFPPCDDHSPGPGNMLGVNGSNTPNTDVWCQTISVDPNSDFNFSMWVGTIFSPVQPSVRVTVNGQQIGGVFSPAGGFCNWTEFSAFWQNPGVSSVEVCIENIVGGTFGPYYALDDISFVEICEQSAQVTVDVIDVVADILPPDPITCVRNVVTLDGTSSSQGSGYSFQWSTTGGHFVGPTNSLQVNADQPGTYTLTITYNSGGLVCTKSDMVVVPLDRTPPVAIASVNGRLTCTNQTAYLSGAGSSTGSNFSYLWTTANGNILSGETSLAPLVDEPGTYTLTVTNNLNGCIASASTTMVADRTPPVAAASGSANLNCTTQPTLQLSGAGSSSGPAINYRWETPDGNIVTGANTLSPVVDQPGTYILTVTNSQNGCESTAQVVVGGDKTLPDASAYAPDMLTCDVLRVILDGSGSSQGSGFTYAWTTAGGRIVSGGNTLFPEVDLPGTYTLTVTRLSNGCRATVNVLVQRDIRTPRVEAGPNRVINCATGQVALDGSGSDYGGGYAVQWTTPNGRIASGTDSLAPRVVAAGTYFLTVTNLNNGCAATDSVVVTRDVTFPLAVIDTPKILDCRDTLIRLNGSRSTAYGAPFTFRWSTVGGHFFPGRDTLVPLVDSAGTYILVITNTANGCRDSATVTVSRNATLPLLRLLPVDTLSCKHLVVTIDATRSARDSVYRFRWIAPAGIGFLSGDTTLRVQVDSPGLYRLSITDTTSQCQSIAQILVRSNFRLPIIEAGAAQTFSCRDTLLQLRGSIAHADTTHVVFWQTPNGRILGRPDSLQVQVGSPGLYILQLRDTLNGCTASDSVLVLADVNLPIVVIAIPTAIDCQRGEVTLDASGSSQGTDFRVGWSTLDGNILAGQNGLAPIVDAPGLYELSIENLTTGCRNVGTVAVVADTSAPIFDFLPFGKLDCTRPTLEIPVQLQGDTTRFRFNWSTIDGSISGGQSTTRLQVSAPGIYDFQVTDIQNRCSSSGSILVEENRVPPVFQILTPGQLTCSDSVLTLHLASAGILPGWRAGWSSLSGNGFSSTEFEPDVNAPGTYVLEIQDTSNGCSSLDTIEVLADRAVPMVEIRNLDYPQLDCRHLALNLLGVANVPASSTAFAWTGNGFPLRDSTFLVLDSGEVRLQVLNLLNGCQAEVTKTITADFQNPTAAAGADKILTCDVSQLRLDGTASSAGSRFSYSWTSPDGNIHIGGNTLQPTVDAAGEYILHVLDEQNGCTATDTSVVTSVAERPVVVSRLPDTINCNRPTVVLDASGSSSGAEFSIEWTTPDGFILTGANSLQPEVVAGSYLLHIVHLPSGCSNSLTVRVLADLEFPDADAGGPYVLTCAQPVITLSGNGSSTGANFRFSWTTADGRILSGSNSLQPRVDARGTYNLVVVNLVNGCSATDQVQVVEDLRRPDFSALPVGSLNCRDTVLALAVSTLAPVAAHTFVWATGNGHFTKVGNLPAAEIDMPGDYTVVVIFNATGCLDSTTFTVSADIDLPLAVANAGAAITCANRSTTLSSEGSSIGTDISYRWSGGTIVAGAGSAEAKVSAPGWYQLEVLNATNGCSSRTIVLVRADTLAPNVNISPAADLTCLRFTTSIEASVSNSPGARFSWLTSDGVILTRRDSSRIEVGAPGLYTLTVTNPANGCAKLVTTEVLQDTTPPRIVILQPEEINCSRQSVRLDAGGSSAGSNFVYQWTTSDGNITSGIRTLTPTVDAPGTYRLTITNIFNSCTASDSIVVRSDPDTLVSIELSITQPDCLGNLGSLSVSAVAGGQAPVRFSLDGGATFSPSGNFSNLQPGAYQLLVRDSNGCELRSSFTIELPIILSASLPPEITLSLGERQQLSLTLNVADSTIVRVAWSPADDLSCSNCLRPVVMGNVGREYTVQVTDRNGCEATATFRTIVSQVVDVYIPNAFSPNDDGINDRFTVFAKAESVARVRRLLVFDRWGTLLFEGTNLPVNEERYGWDGSYRGKRLNAAVFVYFAEVEFIHGEAEIFKGDVTLMR